MKSNKQSSNNIIVGVVIVAIFILLMSNFSLSNQLQRLQQDANELQYNFYKIVIRDWEIEDKLLISAPACNRDEAIEISKELFKDLSFMLD